MAMLRPLSWCLSLGAIAAGVTAALHGAPPSFEAGLITTAAGGAAGNFAYQLCNVFDKRVADHFLQGRSGIAENHVVEQSLRLAQLKALGEIHKRFRATQKNAKDQHQAERFSVELARFLGDEAEAAEKLFFARDDGTSPTTQALREDVLQTLPDSFNAGLAARCEKGDESAIAESLRQVRAMVEAAVLSELRAHLLRPGEENFPAPFPALFVGDDESDGWFDLYIREAAERIKDPDGKDGGSFARIWNAERTAYIDAIVNRIDQNIVAGFRRVEDKLQKIMAKMDASGYDPRLPAGHDIIFQVCGAVFASKFSGTIRAFLEEYLVSETATERVPFGGRSKELAYLDNWLNDPASPSRVIVAGQAGRGKSALLVHWVTRITTALQEAASECPWHVVFVPISIRFNTNRPAVFYEAIAARLAAIAECELRPAHNDPAAYYEDQCRILVETILDRDQATLIVIDGVDEALGDGFSSRWFPRQRGGRLRLLLSARLQIGDVDATGWARRLGWDRAVRYSAMQLLSLDIAGVKNLLISTGAPLDVLAARPEIIDKLHRLSEGEPLILRLYVEDLWLRTQSSQELSVEDLDHIKPGLSGYFEDWLERQGGQWREDGRDGAAASSRLMPVQLALLACAHGPLLAEDVGALLRHFGCETRGLRIEDGLHPLRRFVIGAGKRLGDGYHGYILSHPRFGQFLREEYLDEFQVRNARIALAKWGDEIVQHVNDGVLGPSRVPAYVLNYHSEHLADADFKSDSFMRMVEPNWLRAWEEQEGAYHGFSKDVAAATRSLLREKPRVSNWRSSLVRCALFQTSIANLAAQVPEDILLPCVKAGLMTSKQVLHWLEFHSPSTRCRILVNLAPLLDNASVPLALDACRAIGDSFWRMRALAAVATRLESAEQHAVLSEVMSLLEIEKSEVVDFLQNSYLIGETLSAVSGMLDHARLEQAGEVAAAMTLSEHRVNAFLALGRAAELDRRAALFREALSALHAVKPEAQRREILESLAPYLTLDLLYPVIKAVTFDGPLESLPALLATIPVSLRLLAYEAAIRLHLDAESMIRSDGRGRRYATAAVILRHLPVGWHPYAVIASLAFIVDHEDYRRCLSELGELIPEQAIQVIVRHAAMTLDKRGFADVIATLSPLLSAAIFEQLVGDWSTRQQLALCTKLLRRLSAPGNLLDLVRFAAWIPAPLLSALLIQADRMAEESFWSLESYTEIVDTALHRLPAIERVRQIEFVLRRLVNVRWSEKTIRVVKSMAPLMAELWRSEASRFILAAQDSQIQVLLLTIVAPMLEPAERELSLALLLPALRNETHNVRLFEWEIAEVLPMLPSASRVEAIKLVALRSQHNVDRCLTTVPEPEQVTLISEVLDQLLTERPIEQVFGFIRRLRRKFAPLFALAVQRLPTEQRIAIQSEIDNDFSETLRTEQPPQVLANQEQQTILLPERPSTKLAEETKPTLQERLRASMTIGDGTQQFRVLGALLDHLPNHLASGIAAQAVARLSDLQDPRARGALLQAVSTTLEPSHLRGLLDSELATLSVNGESKQIALLEALVPLFSEEQRCTAWQAAVRFGNPTMMLQAVASLVSLVPPSLVDGLFKNSDQLPDGTRAELLILLAPRIPSAELPALFSELARLQNPRAEVRALFSTVCRLVESEQRDVLERVIAFARNDRDFPLLAHAMIASLELGAVQAKRSVFAREALDAISRMEGPKVERIAALKALGPHLTPPLVTLALRESSLWAGHNDNSFVAAMVVLRPYLSADMVEQLVADAETSEGWNDMKVLADFAAELPSGLHFRAFNILQRWDDEAEGIKAKAKLLGSLDSALQDQELTELNEAAPRMPRRVILDLLPNFLPVIVAAEGPDGAIAIGRAVIDVGNCLP